MTEYDRVFVPLSGVMADYCPQVLIEALAQAAACRASTASAALLGSGFMADCARGNYSLDAQLDEVRARLNADLTEAHLQGLWSLAYEPRLAAIEALADARLPRPTTLVEDSPLLEAGLDAYLPEIPRAWRETAYSFQHGSLTTDSGLYGALAKHYGHDASRTAVISDDPRVRSAAEAAGWGVLDATRY
ncbi:MAG: hypothetical protein HOI95_23585 [Chromatiales bacterium]|nr:hypothetical protein [Chromatiales bacterium]